MKVICKWMLAAAMLPVSACYAQAPVWKSAAYQVYRDSIVQGKYAAAAASATELSSSYQSQANLYQPAMLSFKFSINGRDNEMPSGMDHHFNCIAANGYVQTPLIKFGSLLKATGPENVFLAPNTKLRVRLDMREVLAAFKEKGYYTTFNGGKIYKEDFKGVFIAGSAAPMTWDFDNLATHSELELKDDDGDGIYETTLTMNVYDANKHTASHWKLSKDISAFPQYQSPFRISDALYNLSLEEMLNAVEKDSTFRTGKEWAGVWTRDISYSIILSMAYLQPQVAKYSLMKKVNSRRRIIQDTGTGGAWPVSTDRIIWAVAAWEVYKATGDRQWLSDAYTIIKNSLEDDYQTAYDSATGLVRGESSFLDWREQTYPRWMQPADIYASMNLGTNAVHYEANKVLGRMALLLHKPAEAARYEGVAGRIRAAINKQLWMPEKKYYAQYLYGRAYKSISPRSEALGEALTVLFDIADSSRRQQVVANTPVTDFGITCIYPQIPGIPPYHNNAVWPFVQSFWLWAAAKAGNESAVMESISAIYRPAALFLTNKENFVASTGDFSGTQINSSNMLWSLAGNISIVHKVLFGIHFQENGLLFQPFVPRAYGGHRSLTGFKYRNAVLNISLEGYGNSIRNFYVDGKPVVQHTIPAALKGVHEIKIVLGDTFDNSGAINKVAVTASPAAPEPCNSNGLLQWPAVKDAVTYQIWKNGRFLAQQKDTAFKASGSGEYSVMAVNDRQAPSFMSEPVMIADSASILLFEAENAGGKAAYPYKGFSGSGFAEISTTINTTLSIPIDVPVNGHYLLDLRYANGNGPVNTENKCAVRTLLADGQRLGTIVLPQRGKGEWSDWGYTNVQPVYLAKGKHTISLALQPADANMNGEVNQAMVDYLRLVPSGGSQKVSRKGAKF